MPLGDARATQNVSRLLLSCTARPRSLDLSPRSFQAWRNLGRCAFLSRSVLLNALILEAIGDSVFALSCGSASRNVHSLADCSYHSRRHQDLAIRGVRFNSSRRYHCAAQMFPPSAFHLSRYSVASNGDFVSVCLNESFCFSIVFVTKGVNWFGIDQHSFYHRFKVRKRSPPTHVESIQVRTDICPYFPIIDLVSAIFGVSTHCTSAVAFVEVVRALLSGEWKAAQRLLKA